MQMKAVTNKMYVPNLRLASMVGVAIPTAGKNVEKIPTISIEQLKNSPMKELAQLLEAVMERPLLRARSGKISTAGCQVSANVKREIENRPAQRTQLTGPKLMANATE